MIFRIRMYYTGVVGLFTVFSSMVFTSSVVSFGSDITDLKWVYCYCFARDRTSKISLLSAAATQRYFFFRDALFFFLLFINLSKAATLAQYALSSRSQEEVKANIARGMSLLGPTITLDTLVEALLISIGSLSGVRRLEILCTYVCLGVIVNYVVFITFYPACLSLILEV